MDKIVSIRITEEQRRDLLKAFTVVERDLEDYFWDDFNSEPETTYRSAVILKERLSMPETPDLKKWVIWWDVTEHELICLISVMKQLSHDIDFYADNYEANSQEDFINYSEDKYNEYCFATNDISKFEKDLYNLLCDYTLQYNMDE